MARTRKAAGDSHGARGSAQPGPVTNVASLPVVLTIEEAANLLRIHPTTAKDWARAGKLPGAFKLGGREWRVRRDELLQAIGAEGDPASGGLMAEKHTTLSTLHDLSNNIDMLDED
jgi:excisionase family DNA binding protein